jgi:serine/threonine-protein kinase
VVEDHDSERLTDVLDAVGPGDPGDDDALGMRIGPGTEVGGYVIDGELGHGGMGVVYSATHPVIGKRAAIKILRPEVSRSPIAVQRFIQEARAVNQIGHPNIVDIFAYGALPDGRAYHVMDLLVGEPLRRRLKRSVLHPSEAASVIDDIASALIAAHEHGFVHRDLKPDNVFLVSHQDRWPAVKLLDFGLAKLMPEYGVASFTTKVGAMLGTPEYMSPEQARGVGVDHRTDIYALGVVMFESIAGKRPFPVLADSFATLLQHAEEPPLSLADSVADLPPEMVQLVDAMLAKTPQARPSLAAVRAVIKRLRATQQLPTHSLAGKPIGSLLPGGLREPPRGTDAPRSEPHAAPRAHAPSTPPYHDPRLATALGSQPLAPVAPAKRLPPTIYGVPPPPKQHPAKRAEATVVVRRAPPRWLVVGALLTVVAAVAVAVVLALTRA